MTTLLNAIPHAHHLHQKISDNTHKTTHHHNKSDHHHPASEKQEKTAFRFSIDFLIQHHLQSVHSHECIQIAKQVVSTNVKKQLKTVCNPLITTSLQFQQKRLHTQFTHYKYVFYKAPIIGETPLRGPPYLG